MGEETGTVKHAGNKAVDVKAIVFASNTGNGADVSPALLNANLENGSIMPFPSSSSQALQGVVDITGYHDTGFFVVVSYQGTFLPQTNGSRVGTL